MRIGLVGGGPSCTAAFIELSRKLVEHLSEIVIFDPAGIFSSPAFNTETDFLLANTSVGVTSILSNNDADFLNWLRDRHPELNARPESFVPRHLVRKYALSRFQTARDLLASFSCKTTLVTEEVTDIRGLSTGIFWVTTERRTVGPLDAVILGTGAKFKQTSYALENAGGYIASPYPESELVRRTAGAQDILVLGTKLSAIDAAVTILENSRTARVVLASPSGSLPAVRDQLLVHRPGAFHARSLLRNEPRSLLRAAERAAAADLKILSKTAGKPSTAVAAAHSQLMQDIIDCELGQNGWQRAMGSFIEEANHLWPHLSDEEQIRLRTKHGAFISRFVSSFPLENARRLAKAIGGGRLSIQTISRGIPVRLSEDGRLEGKGLLDGYTFDRVVNATGIEPTGFRNTTLYRNLLARRDMLNIHGGLDVAANTMRIKSAAFGASIYAMGAPVTGSLLVTNYMRSSVIQAQKIADDIAATAELRLNRYTAA